MRLAQPLLCNEQMWQQTLSCLAVSDAITIGIGVTRACEQAAWTREEGRSVSTCVKPRCCQLISGSSLKRNVNTVTIIQMEPLQQLLIAARAAEKVAAEAGEEPA